MARATWLAPITLILCLATASARSAPLPEQDDRRTPDAESVARLLRDASGARPDRAETARTELDALTVEAVPLLARHLEESTLRAAAIRAIDEAVERAISRLARVGPDAITEEERERLEASIAAAGPLAASGVVAVLERGRGATREAAERIWKDIAGQAPTDDAGWERVENAVPLSSPLLHLYREIEELRDRADAIAGRAADAEIRRLSSDDFRVREDAARVLLRLGPLADPTLADAQAAADPHLRHEIRRLRRQIDLRMTPELVRRIGHRLDGYEELGWRGRRAEIYRLERLGKEEALPTLRRLLVVEPSLAVRVSAAEALARLGDQSGLPVLQAAGLAERYKTPQVTIGIYHDQGIRYLRRDQHDKAAEEFRKILEIDPDNALAHYNLACAYSLMGRTDEAIEHLRLSIENGFEDFEHMERDDDLDPIREDPRYIDLMETHNPPE